MSRGAAFGDLDNDGDPDVVILNNNGPVRLLENRVGQENSWLGLRLLLGSGGDALGARASLLQGGDLQFRGGPKAKAGKTAPWRRVATAGSYASSNDPRLLFGLGDDENNQTVWVE